MTKRDEYIKLLREHEKKWGDSVNFTAEYARTIMNDEEYAEWYADLKARMKLNEEAIEEYSSTHYFPGCYGDPLTDCG